MTNIELIDKLNEQKRLSHEEWIRLFDSCSEEDLQYAMSVARGIACHNFGNNIYFRGIIEFSNICRNDCYYCGIRKSNTCISRYRLDRESILKCCQEGYESGFRTFVLQSGEDGYFTDERLCDIIGEIHGSYPDCAITLSLGERERSSYQSLFDSGAERYLLRHETITPSHYRALHPDEMKLENRIGCLRALKDIGFQTGCGIMAGSPYQTSEHLANDMEFMADFNPEMVGIGPFIPHSDTPFGREKAGNTELTLLCLAVTRIMLPWTLLPSTTALGTVRNDGRQRGILAGCNVVMPNLSPASVREKYMLYDNKVGAVLSPAEEIAGLTKQMNEIGYKVVMGRGDFCSFGK